MAMRIFSEDEWHEDLRTRWKLIPTGVRTVTTQIWMTPAGKPISIPNLGEGAAYPDSLLEMVSAQLTAMGENPFQELIDSARQAIKPPPTQDPRT